MNWTDFQNLTEEEKEKLWELIKIDSSLLTPLCYQKAHPEHKKLGNPKYSKKSLLKKFANMTKREKFDYLTSNK